ncbi:hypothetical protein VFPBJ_04394 [Purpureocillium lilacinum]|uniref:Uncharacterized protein n=1 Tax=Purpureocillium lilacinum TaxID=33203 RepID=A0A179GX02_PURLI|nr:hypothetical protein VFPBJ_04394 [Purpureocillium lilacinum]
MKGVEALANETCYSDITCFPFGHHKTCRGRQRRQIWHAAVGLELAPRDVFDCCCSRAAAWRCLGSWCLNRRQVMSNSTSRTDNPSAT